MLTAEIATCSNSKRYAMRSDERIAIDYPVLVGIVPTSLHKLYDDTELNDESVSYSMFYWYLKNRSVPSRIWNAILDVLPEAKSAEIDQNKTTLRSVCETAKAIAEEKVAEEISAKPMDIANMSRDEIEKLEGEIAAWHAENDRIHVTDILGLDAEILATIYRSTRIQEVVNIGDLYTSFGIECPAAFHHMYADIRVEKTDNAYNIIYENVTFG